TFTGKNAQPDLARHNSTPVALTVGVEHARFMSGGARAAMVAWAMVAPLAGADPAGWASGLGASARDGGVACGRLALDAEGAPSVGFADPAGSGQVYLEQWTGQEWAGLGGSDDGGGVSLGAGRSRSKGYFTCLGAIAFDSLGRPYLGW